MTFTRVVYLVLRNSRPRSPPSLRIYDDDDDGAIFLFQLKLTFSKSWSFFFIHRRCLFFAPQIVKICLESSTAALRK